MTDTTGPGTETVAAGSPEPALPTVTDIADLGRTDGDGTYEWVTGLPLGRTREMTASDAPPPARPARAIAFSA
jgi:hypothetical protein